MNVGPVPVRAVVRSLTGQHRQLLSEGTHPSRRRRRGVYWSGTEEVDYIRGIFVVGRREVVEARLDLDIGIDRSLGRELTCLGVCV